ncbi:MAG: alpha/beta hydrolase [Clostridia bacterium]|nr:alpha/beta hydrolase [Clostridia bacterium]
MKNIKKTIDTFKSSDGLNQVYYYIYEAETYAKEGPKGIVQISHGMTEYLERYENEAGLIEFLVGQGYVVCGNDHLGHGRTSDGEEGLDGYMAEDDGYLHVLEDLHQMTEIIKYKFPGLPLFMFGHSMGSFFARLYGEVYGKELAGLIISGTSGPNPLANVGKHMVNFLTLIKGSKAESKLIQNMSFGSYNKRIENAKTVSDWLSRDDEIVRKYRKDDKCTFLFKLNGYKNLMAVLSAVNRPEWAASLPKNLPIYIFSGEEDPVGEYGKGVKLVYRMLVDAGIEDLKFKLYEDARHEVHNELMETRNELFQDLKTWLGAHL